MTAAAGLGIAALAGLAFVLSYDDLRVLALAGGAARGYAPFYPIMIDTLVVVTILSLVVARRTRWWARGVRWLLLLVLLAGAAAASTQRALHGYDPLPDQTLSAGVAITPWALLLIAVWLWLSMFRQARVALAARPAQAPAAKEPKAPEAPKEGDKAVDQIMPWLIPQDRTETGQRTTVPATLPTDVRLVTRTTGPSETTQPDIVLPGDAPDSAPDSVPGRATDSASDSASDSVPDSVPGSATDTDEDDDVERWSALAAEDAERWAEEAAGTFAGGPGDDDEIAEPKEKPAVQWIPPSSTFRSSPTPPRE
jgi:hypothetical protein